MSLFRAMQYTRAGGFIKTNLASTFDSGIQLIHLLNDVALEEASGFNKVGIIRVAVLKTILAPICPALAAKELYTSGTWRSMKSTSN